MSEDVVIGPLKGGRWSSGYVAGGRLLRLTGRDQVIAVLTPEKTWKILLESCKR